MSMALEKGCVTIFGQENHNQVRLYFKATTPAAQVDRAVKSRLAGPGPGPDQMVAVMDAEGASSWQVSSTGAVASYTT